MKVNDYVRTKYGIEKITDIKEWVNFQGYEKIITTDKNQYETLYEQSKIIKSSPDIIDLIEYGDIVKYKIDNEEFISEVWGEKNNYFVQNFDVPIDLEDLNIVSIVTKEQFESMEYKVKE